MEVEQKNVILRISIFESDERWVLKIYVRIICLKNVIQFD